MKTEQTAPVIESTTPKKYQPAKFVYMDNVFKGLEIAFKNNENIVLYGPGE